MLLYSIVEEKAAVKEAGSKARDDPTVGKLNRGLQCHGKGEPHWSKIPAPFKVLPSKVPAISQKINQP